MLYHVSDQNENNERTGEGLLGRFSVMGHGGERLPAAQPDAITTITEREYEVAAGDGSRVRARL